MGDLTDEELAGVEDHITSVDNGYLIKRLANEIRRRRAARTADADQVRAVVRETAHARVACVAGWDGFSPGSINRMVEDIADRVAAQLTSPPPGHVCPASYALGPDDLDLLQELVDHPTRLDGALGTRQVIRNILAAHRAPEPEDGPLPEAVRCGAVGCVSLIRKSYLPSGWVRIDGAWRCPRCKLEVPS